MKPKTIPTAATEVIFGSRTPIRNAVRKRIFLLSQFASSSASINCGTVPITNSPKVTNMAFQNLSSVNNSW